MEKAYDTLPQNERTSEDDSEYQVLHTVPARRRWWAPWTFNLVVLSALLVSLAQNWSLHRRNVHLASGTSEFSGLPTNIPYTYTYETDYFSFDENATLATERWEDINLDFSVVAVSPEYIAEHNLQKSSPFPWDTERDVYFLKMGHSLHCLKFMRKAFIDLVEGNEEVIAPEHVLHCLDSLRQDIMCKADDTLMPSPRVKDAVGDGQILQCRDFSKVVEWAMAPERAACYHPGRSYRPVIHSLELYANCPPDSPYYSVMTEYFEKHGHQQAWADELL